MPPLRLGLLAAAFALCLPSAPAQTFVQRTQPGDLRVVTYNVLWDTIFPSVDAVQAAKFERVIDALDPDVLNLQEIDYNTSLASVLALLDTIHPVPGGWSGHKAGDCVIASRWPLTMKATATIPAGDKDQAMALVDLPDASWPFDLYVMNNHYKCCGGFDNRRQKQSDSIIAWMKDARTPGGAITLPSGTPMMVVGDLNIVDGPQPLQTLIDGNIIDNATYGPDSKPDWDGSDSLDQHPLHNVVGPADWTWYSPGAFPAGRLDYMITTDSVLPSVHAYLLDTTLMSPAELAANGLLANDVTIDSVGIDFDHVPMVVDFRGTILWDDLGHALAGTNGLPSLVGEGALVDGGSVALTLTHGKPGGSAWLVLGFSRLAAPFKGGVLVPSPDLVFGGLPIDGAGSLPLAFPWPPGAPSGLVVFAQEWFADAGGPVGFAASNAVSASVP